ncbi:hypothetical protein [Nocardioides campestrisoli]|uniref:hypothetical protein n=1 Tax=Nocardioides campestrisoli TaxID=2736757 RepID=UPI0015E735B8|nr:hypothetical protein [Nocardioides campestrisoli]
MLSVRVAGAWLSTISGLGGYGPITVEHGLHGLDRASWSMDPDLQHPALHGNALVTIYDGGFPIGSGTLVEPGADGEYEVRGLWMQADGVPALAADGSITTTLNEAIDQAILRGDVWWTRGMSFSAEPFGEPTGETTLGSLLDSFCAAMGTRWRVFPPGVATHGVDEVAPRWRVPHAVAGRGLTPAEDEFYTHLAGRYVEAVTGQYRTEMVGSAEAAAQFGRRTRLVDLTKMGPITQALANEVLVGMLLRSGARMGWGEGLELGHGQITTLGSTPADLAQVQAGHVVRLDGVADVSRPGTFRPYTDILIERSRYTDGEQRISLTPQGYAPRSYEDILQAAIEGAA